MANRGKTKQPFPTYCVVHAALVVSNVLLCIALILLQNRCLNARTDDFVESYCVSDNRMRAVVSFVLAILIFNLAASLIRAVKSFRTYRMMSGINEGVFIAMLSGFNYRLMAIKKRMWTAAILAVMLFEVVPPFWQTISNYAITTELVFVKVEGSKVEVYNEFIDYGKGLDIYVNLPRLLGAEGVIPSLASLSNPEISQVIEERVQTSVIRDGIVRNITSSQARDDLSFKFTDIVATISTSCNSQRRENVSFFDDGEYVKKMLNGQGSAVRLNSSYTTRDNMSSINTENSILCYGDLSSCDITVATCKSYVSLAKEDVIYTGSNRKVKSIQTVDANVDINLHDFTNVTNALVGAPERIALDITSSTQVGTVNSTSSIPGLVPSAAGDPPNSQVSEALNDALGLITDKIPNRKLLQDIGFLSDTKPIETGINYIVDGVLLANRAVGTGLFRSAAENELHTRVCSAAAIALTYSQALTIFSLKAFPSSKVINAPRQYFDLFTIIPQAYMPVYYVWIVAAFFVLSVVFFAILDFASFFKSKINVRENNELALVDNIGVNMAIARKGQALSNDTDKQMSESFNNRTMYMREEGVSPDVRLVVEYADTPSTPMPLATTEYV